MRLGVRSSLMSAQGRRPLLEVECCDSRFDKYLTSPRSLGMFRYRGNLDTGQQKQQAPGGLLKGMGRLTSCVYFGDRTHKSYSQTTLTYYGLCQCMPALDSSEKNREWFAATSLNPLCRMRMFPLGFPNETHLPLYMDDKRRRGEVRRYDMRTSLVSAQGMRALFEVKCCGSRFDETPTSSGSADEYIPSKTILTSRIHRSR